MSGRFLRSVLKLDPPPVRLDTCPRPIMITRDVWVFGEPTQTAKISGSLERVC